MTYHISVLVRTPIQKYSYMLMTQKNIFIIIIIMQCLTCHVLVIRMMNRRRFIRNQSDQQKLQSILNLIKKWSDEWLVRLNIDKCKSASYCMKQSTDTDYRYHIMDRNQLFPLESWESKIYGWSWGLFWQQSHLQGSYLRKKLTKLTVS